MGILSNVLSGSTAKFVGFHMLRGLVLASGHSVRPVAPKVRNMQCVKLTKEHDGLTKVLLFWCNLRINKLQQLGTAEEAVQRVVREDARFLSILNHAIATAGDDDFDAWLFFDNDVQSTDHFELQYCSKGTKVTKAAYVIRSEC
ncbi:hypothetical protein [Ralstonia phage RP31]|uniref:Uncharacterized protein n=2 Tax=Ripduovirus RP12 TaxID=2560700 RepID=A0A1L7N0U1_9CAUD|nr:hypothetical protein FDH28_gp115 [Ralstonia phage RP12]BAW19089.1 hypothetical protein [Ralstonia phage RP12]BAW19375.1 hypothetical protein [Ralstonia phage RP31]